MQYVCQICGYIYDDSKEKVPFDKLPDSWVCPLCGASKADFKPLIEEKKKERSIKEIDPDLVKLNIGELSIICSSLAKGCEKQNLLNEAEMFNNLAEYFKNIRVSKSNSKVEDLLNNLNSDISEYSEMKDYFLDNDDRGAARVSVWGMKVTRMLQSLVSRYINEGDKLLYDTDIWVCSVCGFVFVGDNPPEVCPVCKVPSWKFLKVEGKA